MGGIRARVTRKENKRFLTGKGRYTDDMVVPGMKFAYFVRSPYAHAKIKGVDATAAKAMPGVIDVLDGKQLLADGIGNLICGWMIHSKDGTPVDGCLAPARARDGAICRRRRGHRRGRHLWRGLRRGRKPWSSATKKNCRSSPRPSRRSNRGRRSFILKRRAT